MSTEIHEVQRDLSQMQRERLSQWLRKEPHHRNGIGKYYRHAPLCRNVVYTDGIKEMCETLQCWWLLDTVGSYIQALPFWKDADSLKRIMKLQVFADNSCRMTISGTSKISNTGEDIIQEWQYTDIPINEIVWYIGYYDDQSTIVCLPIED